MSVVCQIMGTKIMFGNNVSHAKNRTRTTWAPNVRNMRIHSQILGYVSMLISSRGLRTLDKHGGLDEFLKTTVNRKLTDECKVLKKRLQRCS